MPIPDLPDASWTLIPDWLPPDEAQALMEFWAQAIPWRQEYLRLFGQLRAQPRLTAWYGDPGTAYTYSGLHLQPQPWLPSLQALRHRVVQAVGQPFNSVLLNYYRDGRDSMGWHSDDEAALGPAPVIASVSLGATRRFALRHRQQRQLRHRLDLPAGSLLIMPAGMQAAWQHALPKTRRPVAARLNLTFRYIYPSGAAAVR